MTSLLVLDKPAGVAAHGGSGVSRGVIEQLRLERPELRFLELVHRLDRDTSGVLLLAKKRSALTALHEQIRAGSMRKWYLTLVAGRWRDAHRDVQLPLTKFVTAAGERRVNVDHGRVALAHAVQAPARPIRASRCWRRSCRTGRTHQIRVHLQHLGFPIAGDDKYGDFPLNRELAKRGPQAHVPARVRGRARRTRPRGRRCASRHRCPRSCKASSTRSSGPAAARRPSDRTDGQAFRPAGVRLGRDGGGLGRPHRRFDPGGMPRPRTGRTQRRARPLHHRPGPGRRHGLPAARSCAERIRCAWQSATAFTTWPATTGSTLFEGVREGLEPAACARLPAGRGDRQEPARARPRPSGLRFAAVLSPVALRG